MGFMSKATRDKLRGLRRIVPDNVKGRVTGPTKDATGEPNSQSPRRSSGGLRRRSFGGGSSQPPTPAPQQRARNPELQQASAKMDAARARQQSRSGGTPTPAPTPAPKSIGTNPAARENMPDIGDMNLRASRRPYTPATNFGRQGVRMKKGGEVKKTGSTARGCGMAKPRKFKIY